MTAKRRAGLTGRPRALAASVLVVLLAAAGGAGFFWLRGSDGPTSVPSCSWSLRVRGHPEDGQAGLVRCYLRALAANSADCRLAPRRRLRQRARPHHESILRACSRRSLRARHSHIYPQSDRQRCEQRDHRLRWAGCRAIAPTTSSRSPRCCARGRTGSAPACWPSGTTGSSCWPNARPVTCTPPSASPLKFALGANEFSAWNDDAVTSVSEITSSLLSSPIWSLWWD